jgi:hypothetical protein
MTTGIITQGIGPGATIPHFLTLGLYAGAVPPTAVRLFVRASDRSTTVMTIEDYLALLFVSVKDDPTTPVVDVVDDRAI